MKSNPVVKLFLNWGDDLSGEKSNWGMNFSADPKYAATSSQQHGPLGLKNVL